MLGVLTNLTINLNENGKMSIQFQLKTCLKFWTAAWLNISQTSDTKWNETVPSLNASESFFYSIPKECFKKKGFIYSIEIPSNASNICSFKPLTLRECHVYHVDVQGMFLELQGTTTSLDIVFLPGVS